MKDHPTRLRVTCDEHVESPSTLFVSKPRLLLQISSFPNPDDAGLTPFLCTDRNILPHRELTKRRTLYYEFKAVSLTMGHYYIIPIL
jgi:hypothetical protein